MLKLAPAAINVSLFRPYLWEVKNPLMLLAAVESFCVLAFTLYVIWRKKFLIFGALSNPNVIFTLIFSISFAFAVGVSTFNFGTLVRYRVPVAPFFLTALIIINAYEKSDRNDAVFESTE